MKLPLACVVDWIGGSVMGSGMRPRCSTGDRLSCNDNAGISSDGDPPDEPDGLRCNVCPGYGAYLG